MEFVHLPHHQEDTIAAIASPPGEGGVAVIRISGKDAMGVANRIFSGDVLSYRSHTVHVGHVKNLVGEKIDEVVLLLFRAPRSYTGQDVVEIHCHGGSLNTRRVLESVLAAGARPAAPGEFTFRAFRNGKMDLAQAEAVQTLISAKNEEALTAAKRQLEGALSEKVRAVQGELTRVAAILEAWVDFPEEGLALAPMEALLVEMREIRQRIERWIGTFGYGKVVQEGVTVCFVGAPNVGKSSLMNALLEKERAIVSAVPGTTRDLVEDEMRLGGLHCRLVDTAGIREAREWVEQEGIRRTRKVMEEADLLLFVLDAGRALVEDETELLASLPREKTIAVWNKIDIADEVPLSLASPQVVILSAKERRGLDDLRQAMDAVLWKRGLPAKDEVLITEIRHKESLTGALDALDRLIRGCEEGFSPELLTLDIRQCLECLGQIIGTDVTEDILSSIFAQFCIGK